MVRDGSYKADNGQLSALSSGSKDNLTELHLRPQSCPKLGDFTSLRSATVDFHTHHHILTKRLPSKQSSKLGDLSRVVSQLRALESSPKISPGDGLVTSSFVSLPGPQWDGSSILTVSDTEGRPAPNIRKSISTLTASAKQSASGARKDTKKPNKIESSPVKQPMSLARPHMKPQVSLQLTRILTYELSDKGLIIPVFDTARTLEEAHRSLSQNLIPYGTIDCHLARSFPSNALHGIHIFLDMSNIEIGFQKALRKRYGILESARFTTLPRLNLRFLTELLLRGRSSRGLHVGCSILPGRKEPKYIQDLRELGYLVDVRERKRIENGGIHGAPPTNYTSLAHGSKAGSRYVEDLVDETLQTRIAEAVMEYFQEQGTIVLVTGDGKPAQYSDGFFCYVERALRMGWNVELVAWQDSLSSSWTDTNWTDQWGEKFRVIELDSFIYDLLEIQF